jgi:hypothetical protein
MELLAIGDVLTVCPYTVKTVFQANNAGSVPADRYLHGQP